MGSYTKIGNNGQKLYKRGLTTETQAQHRERDLRNNKRKVDWDNDCKQIAFRGPTVDGIPWDEADLKVRSLIYLSLGTEAQRIYQQRFPHSNIERITVFELAHELSLSFTQARNITYDRFLLFTCKQKPNEKLESFHCRLKALGAKCRLGSAEEDLIKDIFIAFMTNPDIQRELLMETRTAQQVLQFALNRERGQENQKAINSHFSRYPHMHRNKYPTLHLAQGTTQSPPDHDHPHGIPRPKDPQPIQIPADAADYSNRPRRYLRGQSPTSRPKHQPELHYVRTRHSHTILRLTRLIPHRIRQLCPHSKRTALRLHGLDSQRTRPRMGHKHPEHHNQGH